MGCSSCKKEKNLLTKEDVERLSLKVEKGVYIFFGVIILLAIYGIYSLVRLFT